MAMEQQQLKTSSVVFDKSNTELSLNSNTTKHQDNSMTEEEAFWLCDNGKTSMSQPTTSKTEERLILGGSQPIPKKNVMLEQKLFGHLMPNPRNNNNNNNNKTEIIVEQQEENILNTQDIPMIMSDDEDDIQIMNRELDHLRHYYHADSPSIGPGFFNSSKVTCAIPLFDNESERQRRERILYKLEKGTLGERLEENRKMEDEMDDDVKAFLSKYDCNMLHESNNEEMSSSQPSSPGSTSSSTQYHSKYNNKPYKKKPIQRRQTRLYKLKFVETR
ncbi:hypothetical protein K501DRAFT_64692 [Backusella circina FSU 941]|nr:hypothetical protein K501DRAFT_64692 [Backusella circina FSU 941]